MASVDSDLFIKTTRLNDIEDILRAEEDLRAGYVVFLNTAEFFDKYDQDVAQLKTSIDRLNDACSKQGGQMARIGSDILVLTPSADIAFF